MANYLKKIAMRTVNLIVNEAHYHAASIASRSPLALEWFQLSSFWNEKGYVTTQKLAPLVFGLPMEEIDPPRLLEDQSLEILDYSKTINISCSSSTIRVVVREGDMSGEHSVNPYMVWRYLRKMHGFTLAVPTDLEMAAKSVSALERKPNRTRKQEKRLQQLKQRYLKLYGEATQNQRDYVDNVVLGGGQTTVSSEAREYLCGRIQYLREFPDTDQPLLAMYIRELELYDDEANSKPPPFD